MFKVNKEHVSQKRKKKKKVNKERVSFLSSYFMNVSQVDEPHKLI